MQFIYFIDKHLFPFRRSGSDFYDGTIRQNQWHGMNKKKRNIFSKINQISYENKSEKPIFTSFAFEGKSCTIYYYESMEHFN